MLNVQIITGSTRPNRVGGDVAKWVYDIAQKRDDMKAELVDVADYELPMFDEPAPPSMGNYQQPHTKKWADKINEADAYVFVTAEYNHAIPGALKNAIDFIYAEWNNKAAGVVSYGSAAGVRAAEHIRQICGEIQVADVRKQVFFSLADDFENYSQFKPRPHHESVADEMFDQVVAWGQALKTLRSAKTPVTV